MKLETQLRLAANLKQLRVSRGLTQAELACQLKIGRSVLAMYESGRRCPDPETLYDIACFYGIRMEMLLESAPEMILSEAVYMKAASADDRTLLDYFRRLSPFARGRLLEKAEDLIAWDAAFSRFYEHHNANSGL